MRYSIFIFIATMITLTTNINAGDSAKEVPPTNKYLLRVEANSLQSSHPRMVSYYSYLSEKYRILSSYAAKEKKAVDQAKLDRELQGLYQGRCQVYDQTKSRRGEFESIDGYNSLINKLRNDEQGQLSLSKIIIINKILSRMPETPERIREESDKIKQFADLYAESKSYFKSLEKEAFTK